MSWIVATNWFGDRAMYLADPDDPTRIRWTDVQEQAKRYPSKRWARRAAKDTRVPEWRVTKWRGE